MTKKLTAKQCDQVLDAAADVLTSVDGFSCLSLIWRGNKKRIGGAELAKQYQEFYAMGDSSWFGDQHDDETQVTRSLLLLFFREAKGVL